MDEQGHLALTDFNVAAVQCPESPSGVHSLAGTKLYMAPEVFAAGAYKKSKPYSFEVDWWSMGVTLYETHRRKIPYEMTTSMSLQDCYKMLKNNSIKQSDAWDPDFFEVVRSLLDNNPKTRTKSCEELCKFKFFGAMKKEEVFNKLVRPTFIPSDKKLNCDPTFELEEMIMENEPLHKKKKRLKELENSHHEENPQEKVDNEKFKKFVGFDRLRDWNIEAESKLLKEIEARKHSTPSPVPITRSKTSHAASTSTGPTNSNK